MTTKTTAENHCCPFHCYRTFDAERIRPGCIRKVLQPHVQEAAGNAIATPHEGAGERLVGSFPEQ